MKKDFKKEKLALLKLRYNLIRKKRNNKKNRELEFYSYNKDENNNYKKVYPITLDLINKIELSLDKPNVIFIDDNISEHMKQVVDIFTSTLENKDSINLIKFNINDDLYRSARYFTRLSLFEHIIDTLFNENKKYIEIFNKHLLDYIDILEKIDDNGIDDFTFLDIIDNLAKKSHQPLYINISLIMYSNLEEFYNNISNIEKNYLTFVDNNNLFKTLEKYDKLFSEKLIKICNKNSNIIISKSAGNNDSQLLNIFFKIVDDPSLDKFDKIAKILKKYIYDKRTFSIYELRDEIESLDFINKKLDLKSYRYIIQESYKDIFSKLQTYNLLNNLKNSGYDYLINNQIYFVDSNNIKHFKKVYDLYDGEIPLELQKFYLKVSKKDTNNDNMYHILKEYREEFSYLIEKYSNHPIMQHSFNSSWLLPNKLMDLKCDIDSFLLNGNRGTSFFKGTSYSTPYFLAKLINNKSVDIEREI